MENTNVETKVEVKTTKEKILFILKIVGNVIFYVVIILLFLFSLMNINSGGKGGIPNLFGKGFLSVQSSSMSRKGNVPDIYNTYEIGEFDKGDLLYVDILNESSINSLKKGDVVSYFDDSLKSFNTHRIVYITYKDNGDVNSISLQGDFSVSFRGVVYNPDDETLLDKNYELQSVGDIQTFEGDNLSLIKGKVTGISYGAGAVLDNIQANWLWYFVFPVAILLIFELFMVIKNFMDLKGTKQKAALATDKEALLAEVQAEKEKMRQELLAELKAQQEAQANATTTETVEEAKEETPAEEVEEPTEIPEQETKSEEEQQ